MIAPQRAAARPGSCRRSSGWASSGWARRASSPAAGPATGCTRCSGNSAVGHPGALRSGPPRDPEDRAPPRVRRPRGPLVPRARSRRRAPPRRPSSWPRPTAAVDELRQGLDPSRVPAVSDVVVDGLGALACPRRLDRVARLRAATLRVAAWVVGLLAGLGVLGTVLDVSLGRPAGGRRRRGPRARTRLAAGRLARWAPRRAARPPAPPPGRPAGDRRRVDPQAGRSSRTTTSMCGVCGNMSTGWTAVTR